MALTHAELLQLKRWNTPTIYNGWEQITRQDAAADSFNLEECRDFMPQIGPMVGYAVTAQCEPSNPEHPHTNPQAWSEYRRYVAGWNCEVEVFGRQVRPGQLIHADKHGFLVIPEEDEAGLLEAARIMDSNECQTLISAARGAAGKTAQQVLAEIDAAGVVFGKAVREQFGKKGGGT